MKTCLPLPHVLNKLASLRKLFRIYSELFHPRKQSRAVEPKTRRSSVITADASFAFGERAHDLIALLPLIFVSNTLLADRER